MHRAMYARWLTILIRYYTPLRRIHCPIGLLCDSVASAIGGVISDTLHGDWDSGELLMQFVSYDYFQVHYYLIYTCILIEIRN